MRSLTVSIRLELLGLLFGLLAACTATVPPAAPTRERRISLPVAGAGLEGGGAQQPPALADLDGDKVPDESDECPTSPERLNGLRDADGCPDYPPRLRGTLTLWPWMSARILFAKSRSTPLASSLEGFDCLGQNRRVEFVVLERVDRRLVDCDRRNIYQATIRVADARAAMGTDALPILNAVVAYVKGHPEYGPLHVDGHAAFNEADPEAIATARAVAVRDWLVANGIPADRLVPLGEGTDLACGPDRPECWEYERRVRLWMPLRDLTDDECPGLGEGQ